MLKQILQDMYVSQEILDGLDEQYKQILFCKMREEQIRRWQEFDKICDEKGIENRNEFKKKVTFRLGADLEPWVWVMGEHENDFSIEEILQAETKQKARKIAENEFLENNQQNLTESCSSQDHVMETTQDDNDELEEIYCKVEDLVSPNSKLKELSIRLENNENNNNNNLMHLKCKNEKNSISIFKDITSKNIQARGKVSAQVAQWEERLFTKRTSEIFKEMQIKKQEIAEEAEKTAKLDEEFWKEQERKAKEAEVKMRDIARRAREEHRKSLTTSDNVIDWYEQETKHWLERSEVPEWFHGLLNRSKAENLLKDQSTGTFLIRLSETNQGYAISYKESDKFKHYLIELNNEKYKFLGENHLEYSSLDELVEYHSNIPITVTGNELLLKPCPKQDTD